jgi:predicted XRE-type DNA-binding protein
MNPEYAHITESSGNVFLDLGFAPDEAALLALRAQLMGELRLWIQASGLMQAEVSTRLGISPSRVSDLVCGKWDKFSLDMLITLAIRAGKKLSLELADAA